MPKSHSAGILVYRKRTGSLEVLLVHPGGPFWARKDEGAWSIPKGEFSAGADALEAARREFREETGSAIEGAFVALAPLRQRSGKLVHAWAVEGDLDTSSISSNTFSIEWPPRSGRQQQFPEIDQAAWFEIAAARRKILAGQRGFLDELQTRLNQACAGQPAA
jgi:predicted NUDIX family NTP pyrophosphohydrolase